VDEIHEVVDHLEAFQWRNFLFRIVQETKWNLVVDSYDRKFEELVAELDESDNRGPGSVSWDPNFEYPDYARHEIHLQPGGYIEHPLAGYHYHINTNIGFVGLNNTDGVQRSLVKQLPEPDGGVSRILDLGCSIGQSTTCLKERFPNAEIWGIDLSAPMVRYAHRRAVHFDSDVHFAQMLVEDLKFPDNHFDVVYAYILFHELPAEISRQAIKEAYRVLRPGGIFNVFDFGKDRYRSGTPYNTYLLRYMVEHNNEVYAEEFCTMDFEGDCERAGFSRVSETSTNGISQIVATK
jgi:ubiquinone/menaquinone biosynthesis C-methylase UbiE